MIFEGPEKKLEVVTDAAFPSLRALEAGFWEGIVRQAGAQVVSRVSTKTCEAYLLCESSLFVYDRRAVMITCGRTKLIESALAILDKVPGDHLVSLIYERKNEYFPELQHSTFAEDTARLQQKRPGRSVIFGNPTGDHIAVYHLDHDFDPDPEDATLEVLMYEIDPTASRRFANGASKSDLRQDLGLSGPEAGVTIDDHLFDPMGYSLNAVCGEEYTTLHVTPQKKGSYTSFETNHGLEAPALAETVSRLLRLFSPRRADLLLFQKPLVLGDLPADFRVNSTQGARLSCGYVVEYAHVVRNVSSPPRTRR